MSEHSTGTSGFGDLLKELDVPVSPWRVNGAVLNCDVLRGEAMRGALLDARDDVLNDLLSLGGEMDTAFDAVMRANLAAAIKISEKRIPEGALLLIGGTGLYSVLQQDHFDEEALNPNDLLIGEVVGTHYGPLEDILTDDPMPTDVADASQRHSAEKGALVVAETIKCDADSGNKLQDLGHILVPFAEPTLTFYMVETSND